MANPSKQKGTGGETELLRLLELDEMKRTPPGTLWDLERPGVGTVDVLATRPDRGRWLVTLDARDFRELYQAAETIRYEPIGLRIEVKRYRRFSLHTIFESKFGRGK